MTPDPSFPEDMRERVERWAEYPSGPRRNPEGEIIRKCARWALERDAEAKRMGGDLAIAVAKIVAGREARQAAEAKLAEAEGALAKPRMFPLQRDWPMKKPGPTEIPWEIAEEAYAVYAARFGRDQSLERLAERAGFSWGEMDDLLPGWRERVDLVVAQRARLADLEAKLAAGRAEAEKFIERGPNAWRFAGQNNCAQSVIRALDGQPPGPEAIRRAMDGPSSSASTSPVPAP